MTERQRAFCRAYLQTGQAEQAARDAGYSPKDARRTGKRLLKDPAVRQRLSKAGAALPEETAEEQMRRRLVGRMETGELKASEEFKAMEMLWRWQKETRRAEEEKAPEAVKVVRFEGVLEEWSR